ncbi:uncharacterized protein N0V89_012631 [Didymosphaeria variabile]|uniref:Uncharacterized protein n=1 Tax=Didymosphaeria variabile TaxID=1932322 RepID=A0A9W8X9Y6_9PLEO|nr:uncharacterized protein N0V89_012631 [Didymosphaeria variabile]KAJ4344886.1 hypothetical protein N0V89_012631 [Didymosphaeria variabile]
MLKLEKKVDELSDALDREEKAHGARNLSFNYLWEWNSRLEGPHEIETQELKEAGRQLADENTGLRAEIADMDKRCATLYDMVIQGLQERHKSRPEELGEILKSLHNAFGDQGPARKAA